MNQVVSKVSYIVPIFISSFLLFQVQPIIGKYLLPIFGGSSAVWNACLLFFQCLLVCGYLYAHIITRLGLKVQVYLHLLLVTLVLGVMFFLNALWGTPIIPEPVLNLSSISSPVFQILTVLTVSVGLPFFLLSSTSTLVQSWFSRLNNRKSPYSFYAVSNTASLLALLSYPVFFEQIWSLNQQVLLWFAIYLVFTISIVWIVFKVWKTSVASPSGQEYKARSFHDNYSFLPEESEPKLKSYLFWISLSAAGSIILLSVTNRISIDIAPVPFMWVITLSLYLLSFVFSFVNFKVHSPRLWTVLLGAGLLAAWFSLKLAGEFNLVINIIIHSFILFTCCIFCHSQLFYSKPQSRHLSSFYLAIAFGGALGGLWVNLFAPAFFKGFWEYHLGLIYCAATGITILFGQKVFKHYYVRLAGIIILSFFTFLITIDLISEIKNSRSSVRNFYGLLQLEHTIVNNAPTTKFFHNSILHGMQSGTDPFRYEPTSYFTKNSGLGTVFRFYHSSESEAPLITGAIGLGVGTIAAYGRKGDNIRFYEIDPDVIRLASHTRWFTYLKDSQAKIDVVLGDARLSLQKELTTKGAHKFDIFVIDAFSGDSIPVHLLTKEAFDLYLAHMKKDGIIAIHISNRYIEFEPVIQAVTRNFDMGGVVVETDNKNPYGSKWVLMTRNNAFLTDIDVASVSRGLYKTDNFKLWTDKYNSLWKVLK